jgi:hypothetical protein
VPLGFSLLLSSGMLHKSATPLKLKNGQLLGQKTGLHQKILSYLGPHLTKITDLLLIIWYKRMVSA